MKSKYIKDLKQGEIIRNEHFALYDVAKGEDRTGKPYYNIKLGDKTGRISGKIWADNIRNVNTDALKQGNVVDVDFKVDSYNGSLQINITKLLEAKITDLKEFIESSEFEPEDMMKELKEEIAKIKNKELNTLLNTALADKKFYDQFMYLPAARSIHHDFRSGMLQHVLEMLSISNSIRRFYKDLDFDILNTGIIFHDVGKFEEFETNMGTNYTKKGALIGHISIGIEIINRYGAMQLNEDCYLHLCHLILSHHGELQFGSPVVPSTPEAIALSYIDKLSSKTRTALKFTKEILADDEFSKPNLWLSNARLWKNHNKLMDLHEEKEGADKLEIKITIEKEDFPSNDNSDMIEGNSDPEDDQIRLVD
jgi:3'-5' exoribonuclease